MASTTPFYARIDTDLKTKAEAILAEQGLTLANVLSIVCSQIVSAGEANVFIRIPKKPVAAGALSKEELKAEILKGVKDIEEGRFYTKEEMDEIFRLKYGLK